MAFYTILSALLSLFLTLAVDIFALVPYYNYSMKSIYESGLVISALNNQVIFILGIGVMSVPLFVLLFTLIDGFNSLIFRAHLT